MIFHHLTASFGALDHRTLRLKDGLNVIEAPNEWGKSTWCAFLRAMLYGISTRERDTKTSLAEKNRYLPWSGAPMEGELCLTSGGQSILLRRSSRAAAFDTFSAVDAATGAPVPGLTGDGAGQALLGVGREVYERSAFLGQGGGAALGGSAELEKRIAALVSSGEEEVSYSQVQSRLKEWLRRRKFNQTGLIPKLEAERAALEAQLAELSSFSLRIAEYEGQEKALNARLSALKSDLSLWDALERQEQNRRYARYKADWQAAEAEADAAAARLAALGELPDEEALRAGLAALAQLEALGEQERQADQDARTAEEKARAARSETGDFCFLGMTPEEAWRRADADAAEAVLHLQAAAKSGRRALTGGAVGLLAGAAVSALLLVFSPLLPPACAGIGGALFAAAAVLSLLLSRSSRQRHLEEKEAIFDRYGAASAGEIRTLAADYREKWVLAEEAEQAAADVWERAQAIRISCAKQQNALLALVHPFAPAARTADEAGEAIRRVLALQSQARSAVEQRDAAKRIFSLVAEQGGGEVATLEYVAPPEHSREELQAAVREAEVALLRIKDALSSARGGEAALGDRAALTARLEQTTDELIRRREEYEGLSLALQALEAANNAFRARISPQLNRRAGALFSALTGGAYDGVTLSRTFEAEARPTDTLLPRSALTLSAGTVDQLYLAARLAVCELVFPADNPVPLVLDDALCNFDDGRMALALETLLEMAQTRQVLLFTCHNRERLWLEAHASPCNFPEIGI